MACACCTCSPALRRPRERPLPYLNQNPGRPMEKNGLYYRVSYLGLYRVKQGTILMETVYDRYSIHVELTHHFSARVPKARYIYFYDFNRNSIRFVDTILIRFCSGLCKFIPESYRKSYQKSYRNRIDKSYQNRIILILFSSIFTRFRYDLSIRF